MATSEQSQERLRRAWLVFRKHRDRLEPSWQEHCAIAEAVIRGNPGEAVEHLKNHLAQGRRASIVLSSAPIKISITSMDNAGCDRWQDNPEIAGLPQPYSFDSKRATVHRSRYNCRRCATLDCRAWHADTPRSISCRH
jgi:hypothetical protein